MLPHIGPAFASATTQPLFQHSNIHARQNWVAFELLGEQPAAPFFVLTTFQLPASWNQRHQTRAIQELYLPRGSK
jgi:hypothetical protein